MNEMVQWENETLEQFFDRVYTDMRYADNHGEKRPKLSKLYRSKFKLYLENRKEKYRDKVSQRFECEGAGTREKTKGKHNFSTVLDSNGREMRTKTGKIRIKTYAHHPGSMGGRSSTYRSKDCRERYLLEAGDNNFCHACQKRIWTDKAKVLCVTPQEATRKYTNVICKSCSQGENIIMHTRAGNDVWNFIKKFKDAHVRAWIRFKLATLEESKLDKFRGYVLSLSWGITPRR